MKLLINILALLAVVFASPASATLQVPDRLCLDGTNAPLAWDSSPLRGFFELHEDLRPQAELQMTSLNRGYVAHYEIRDQRLFVKDVLVPTVTNLPVEPGKAFEIGWTSLCKRIFPSDNDRWMKWYTGLIRVWIAQEQQGETVTNAPDHPTWRLVYVDAGYVRADREFTIAEHHEYERLQFDEFKKTPEYIRRKQILIDEMADVITNVTDETVFRMSLVFRLRTIVNYKDFRPCGEPSLGASMDPAPMLESPEMLNRR